MASGNHTCSGNCADFPMAPPNNSSAPANRNAPLIPPPAASVEMWLMFDVPAANASVRIPNRNGMSPVFVVMNALMPASELILSSHQWPTSR